MEPGDFAFMLGCTACFYPWVLLTPAVFRIEKRFPLESGNWTLSFGLLAAISLPVCLFAAPLMTVFFSATLAVFHPGWFRMPGWRFVLGHVPLAEALFWCSVFAGYFFRSRFQLTEQEQKTARLALEKSQLEAGLRQAQLDVIRARLNPHFLFNSLQNISAMTKQDPQTASRMLMRLGDLLRAVLRQDAEPESTLQDEIDLTRAYVALEQMRFGDRLIVCFEVPANLQLALVPCFLLQPLIENALIHGMQGVRKTAEIAVRALVADGNLLMSVTDNGNGVSNDAMSGRKVGVGLGTTRDRLSNMYADRHTFTMTKLPQGGTEVSVVIPLCLAGGEALRRGSEGVSVDTATHLLRPDK